MPKHPPFQAGDARTKELARKGGLASQYARRATRPSYVGSVLDVMDEAGMRGPTWEPWRSILRCSRGLPTSGQDVLLYRQHAGREIPTGQAASEVWVVAGRRGGKSRVGAAVGFHAGIAFDANARLAPGELAVVPIIAADNRQARAVMNYVRALAQLDQFRPYVNRILRDAVELKTGVNVEVHTASYRTIRGYTIVAGVLDEVAFWRDDSSSNPDSEILDALRPGMATVPDALLWAISSPYARKGELFATYERWYGVDNELGIVVWNLDTRSLNPAVPERVIQRAFEEDPSAASSEYGRDGRVSFRHDVESFLDPAAVEAVTASGRKELPPSPDLDYDAFCDPSGGSQDSFTLAIAHADDEGRGILDAVRETRPPFSPDSVVEEYAALLRSYGCAEVVGDRYGGEFPRELFRRHGIRYDTSEHTKSDIYRELLPVVNAGRVALLDLPTLKTQLVGLERRVARGGKDSIDHTPGGRDDVANAAAGALTLVVSELELTTTKTYPVRFR